MYAIKSGGKVVGYSDTVVYVRLHENGCYVPCDAAEAEGFCIKTAIDRKDEETGLRLRFRRRRAPRYRAGRLRGSRERYAHACRE